MTFSLPQKLAAEFSGVFALVFIGVGSIAANQLTGGGSGLLGVAFAFGLTIAVMVTATGHISGAHYNPAVTAACWVTKRMDTVEALLYTAAQLAAATAAAFLLTMVLPEDTWRAVRLGTPDLARDVPRVSGMILEAVLTFILVFVIFGSALDSRNSNKAVAGFAIGMTVTACVLIGGPFTGAALNPARAFGPSLVGSYWSGHGVYWVGPLAGGIIAGWLYDFLFLKKRDL